MNDVQPRPGPPAPASRDDAPLSADQFLTEVGARLGPSYAVQHDGTFRWLTPFGAGQGRYAAHAHHGLARLPQLIRGLEPRTPAGGWTAILLASTDDQLAYESLFGGSGASIINGGCWRSHQIPHLAIPVSSWDCLDAAFGNELVHDVLHESGIPVWLQEGIATELETCMGNRQPPLADMHEWGQTLRYWRTSDSDSFWSARAFHDPPHHATPMPSPRCSATTGPGIRPGCARRVHWELSAGRIRTPQCGISWAPIAPG